MKIGKLAYLVLKTNNWDNIPIDLIIKHQKQSCLPCVLHMHPNEKYLREKYNLHRCGDKIQQ